MQHHPHDFLTPQVYDCGVLGWYMDDNGVNQDLSYLRRWENTVGLPNCLFARSLKLSTSLMIPAPKEPPPRPHARAFSIMDISIVEPTASTA